MIFSKDKKPTEAGFYWGQRFNLSPEVIEIRVGAVNGSRLKVAVYGMPTINAFTKDNVVKWGDRIQVPTIESSDGEGGGT